MTSEQARWDRDALRSLAEQIDAAAKGASTYHDLVGRLDVTADTENDPLRYLAMAFQYQLLEPSEGSRGDTFGSMITYTDGSAYPPRLAELGEEVVACWEECAEWVSAPIALARLHDLCFVRRSGNGGDHARGAINAYLQLAANSSERFYQARWLVRALELCRQARQDDLAEHVMSDMVATIRTSLDQSEREPGISLMLLESLAFDRECGAEVDSLLDAARKRYEDAFITADTIRLQKQRARGNRERISELNRELVLAWVNEADQADKIVSVTHLEHAASLARDFGFAALAEEITAKMQTMGSEEFDFKRISAEVEVPMEEVERYLEQFTSVTDWRTALVRLLIAGPPTGDFQDNVRQAELTAKQFPLQTLVSTVLIGSDNLPRYTVITEDDKSQYRLLQQENWCCQVHGPVLAEALIRIGKKWASIPQPELAEFLRKQQHVSKAVAESLDRAFEHYWKGDYEAAAYVAVPRIESLVRALVIALGPGIYRVQRERTPGQYPGLGTMLPILRNAGFDQSWYRFLLGYLTGPIGSNYRNELSHGFLEVVGATNAALVLLSALYLAIGVGLHGHESTEGPTAAEGTAEESIESTQDNNSLDE